MNGHHDWSDGQLDHLLGATGVSGMGAASPFVPPLSDELARAVKSGGARKTRSPHRRASLLLVGGAIQMIALAWVLGFRREIELLPRAWFIAYIAAWALGFAVLGWATQVPPKGQVMSRSALFGPLGLVVAFAFTAGGLIFARHAPGHSTMYDPTLANIIHYAPYCLSMGMVTAVLPIVAAGLLARGAAPIGARWLGIAVGASAGSLGGLLLHLHCPIAERTHLGLVHGGVVLVAALAGLLVVPLLSRVR